MSPDQRLRLCVVIPCFRVTRHIKAVIDNIPASIERIFVVDDACPDQTGAYVERECHDPRVVVLRNEINLGVGGAVIRGYHAAIEWGYHIAIKVDGDGQMDPSLIPSFVAPIAAGQADYAKGTRFFSVYNVRKMPFVRLFGNAILGFFNKLTSGYWSIMDPTNGFTAIHVSVLRLLPLSGIEKRYFFESDMLYQLGLIRAVVADVPMVAQYADEVSHLRISQVLWSFPIKYVVKFVKRFIYNYVLRDFNAGTLATIIGLPLLLFGMLFGGSHWLESIQTGIANPMGTVMLSGLSIILGAQMLLAALLFDVSNQPRTVLHLGLARQALSSNTNVA